MIAYYEYETSPRKLEPEYTPVRRVQHTKQPNRKKVRTQNISRQKKKAKATNKNFARILCIVIGFSVLLLISYRYALINASFNEKENLKTELANIQKQNQQLKVNIEQGMNINTIEQEAKERLGMQKLDNNQKVYVNLEKTDYIESAVSNETENEVETWWSKLFKDLFNIK